MSSGGIQTESNATLSGIRRDASHARTPAPVNPTRPDPTRVERNPTVDPLPHLPSLPDGHVKRYVSPTGNLAQRMSDLETATVRDAELIHNCRWKARAARQRILNRRDELERLYVAVLGADWRES